MSLPENDRDVARVTVAVHQLRPLAARGAKVVALADVEIIIGGVAFTLHGVQIKADGDATAVTLPRYRDADGEWRSAVTVPDELRGPIGDAVIAAGIEAGIVRTRFVAPAA